MDKTIPTPDKTEARPIFNARAISVGPVEISAAAWPSLNSGLPGNPENRYRSRVRESPLGYPGSNKEANMALSVSVDTGTLGPYTLEANWFVTWGQPVFSQQGVGFEYPEFASYRWFRMAPSLAPTSADINLPGTSVAIADTGTTGRYGEAVIIDENQNAFAALTVINTSQATGGAGNLATAYFNWLSAQI